ncbi:juvenile hormone esterase-like isoform X2 [Anthonomus grandis grandis]|uniref:juvenile hormone esterase-like isoform X2 n=1 Tax=Anthonomus grandis grandis TaxID=2921223 RepID=UPI002165691B|nr:juvenile hormone esterase-like isoform X2 [Anthonomus grandis grandis]
MKLMCSVVFFCYIYIADAADLLVSLPYGMIQGKELVSPGNITYRAFQGIPYAAAPVGTLRFQPPQQPYQWEGIKNTTKEGNICFSVHEDSDLENEDCLFMNVYTPILSNSSAVKLPVMLWFYGGGFYTGSSLSTHFGPDFFMEKNVIIAIFNYRVGPFGFLATEDGVISGNAGLKDQVMAIKWVNENIASFGGDPDKVTIFGQSAGGASVGYQLLYKQNEGLFRGAILQSGSPLSSFSFMGDVSPRAYAFDLASQIDNSFDFANDTNLLVNFLWNVTAKQIDVASTLTKVTSYTLPVIEKNSEGAFFTRESYEAILTGDFIRIPIMAGTTSEEDITAFSSIEAVNNSFSKIKRHAKFTPTKGFHLKAGATSDIVGEEIYQLYFGNVSSDEILGHYVKVNKCADFVAHSEDIKYMWNHRNFVLSAYPEADRLTHERVLTLWTNFAKYLNPTPEKAAVLQNVTWPKVKPGNFHYLDIGNDLVVKKNPKSPYYAAWTRIYEQYNERPFTVF